MGGFQELHAVSLWEMPAISYMAHWYNAGIYCCEHGVENSAGPIADYSPSARCVLFLQHPRRKTENVIYRRRLGAERAEQFT